MAIKADLRLVRKVTKTTILVSITEFLKNNSSGLRTYLLGCFLSESSRSPF
jgi:hypothetical protein